MGRIDLDNDQQYDDRERLKSIIQSAGGEIDNEVLDNGELIGNGITYETKFLVIAYLPQPSDTADLDEQQTYEEIGRKRGQLEQQARENGVRVVKLADFLNYIGYVPKQRLWRRGEDYPYRLKAGAASSDVNETLGSRYSSGQVSGSISRSRRLPAPSSSTPTAGSSGGY